MIGNIRRVPRHVPVFILISLVLLVFPAEAAWHTSVADSDGGSYISLALDASGNPGISYCGSSSQVKYAYRDSRGAWSISLPGDRCEFPATSLAFNASGNPGIAYSYANVLKYAEQDSTGHWTIQTVDSDGSGPSLKIDGGDNPSVSYYSGTTVKYAHRNSSGQWNNTTVDSPGTWGYTTSLALDSSGYPRIAYYGQSSLKYAEYNGGVWTVKVVRPGSTTYEYLSLALDASGNPGISCTDTSTGNMRYAKRDSSGSWTQSVVDDTVKADQANTLVFDFADNPHISYYDAGNHVLKYATGSGSAWSVVTVPSRSGNMVGSSNSLALETSGNPVISYYDSTANLLDLAWYAPLTPSFSAAPLSGTAPLAVRFTDTSTGESAASWAWYFGDGATSSQQNPAHTYTAGGTYQVYLTTSDGTGSNTTTGPGVISVAAAPVVSGGSSSGDSDSGTPVSVTPTPGMSYDLVFFVDSGYLADHSIMPADVEMMTYSGGQWKALPTTYTGSTGNRFYFTAQSDGYSVLAVGNIKDGTAGLPSVIPRVAGSPTSLSGTSAIPSRSQETVAASGLSGNMPVSLATTAPPSAPATADPGPGFPVAIVALTGTGGMVLAGTGWYVRRWWIRRQNPALFQEYD
jgi:PKD repeat protein